MIGFADFEAFLKASFPDMTDGMVERFRLMDAGYRDWNAKINVISRKDERLCGIRLTERILFYGHSSHHLAR